MQQAASSPALPNKPIGADRFRLPLPSIQTHTIVVLVVLFMTLQSSGVDATCQTYVGNNICSGIASSQVFVRDGSSLSALQAEAASTIALLPYLASDQCRRAALTFACRSYMPTCFQNQLPEPLHHSVCREYTAECASVLEFLGQSVVDCDQASSVMYPGQLAYPEEDTIRVTTSSGSVTVPVDKADDATFGQAQGSFLGISPLFDLSMKCEYAGRAEHSGRCSPLVEGDVWTSADNPLAKLLITAETTIQGVQLATVACKKATYSYVCASAFMPCNDKQIIIPKDSLAELASQLGIETSVVAPPRNWPVALPSLPAESLCLDFARECGPYFQAIGQDVNVNCSAKFDAGPLKGMPRTPGVAVLPVPVPPLGEFLMDVNTQSTSSDQAFFATFGDNARWSTVCPAPLEKVPDNREQGLPCQVPVPAPVFTRDQYRKVRLCTTILASLTIPATLFLIATYLLFKQKRQHPGDLILWLSFASQLTGWCFLIGPIWGYDNVMTVDRFTEADFNHAVCGFQGIFLVFWSQAATLWWLVIAFNLYATVVLNIKDTSKLVKYYHCACWGIPAFNSVLLAANKKIAPSATSWCFISEDDNFAWQYGTYYGWIFITISFGIYCLGSVVLQIAKIARMTGRSLRGALSMQSRPLLFGLMILSIFSTLFATVINLTANNAGYKESFTAFIVCKIQAVLTATSEASCVLTKRPPYSLTYAVAITSGSQGLLVFAFYGLTVDNFWSWAAVLGVKTKKGSSLQAKRNKDQKAYTQEKKAKEMEDSGKSELVHGGMEDVQL